MSSLWLINLKEGQRHCVINCKTSACIKVNTYKNLEADEKTFINPLPCFGGRKDGDLTPTFHKILSNERDSGATTATTN